MTELTAWPAGVPDACTLPTADRPLRLAEFDSLFATSLRAVERPAPVLARLILSGADRDAVEDLTARETECCSFFRFTVEPADGGLGLDIEVPAAYVDVLDALIDRATRMGGGV
jgi:hypothetical protein